MTFSPFMQKYDPDGYAAACKGVVAVDEHSVGRATVNPSSQPSFTQPLASVPTTGFNPYVNQWAPMKVRRCMGELALDHCDLFLDGILVI